MPIKNDSPYIIIYQQLPGSIINIREAGSPHCLKFPIAEVTCDHCKKTYQTKLPFIRDQPLIVQNHKLECYYCGETVTISYITKKV